jgi:ABC-type oligopeptide transport system ATPase subunit
MNNNVKINENDVPVLRVKNLKKHFKSGHGKNKLVVKAIDGVSFDIYKGQIFGLVGESGCGKTTTGRTIIKLHDPTDGTIEFMGESIAEGTDCNYIAIKEAKEQIKKESDSAKKSELRESIKFNKKEIKRKIKLHEKPNYELMKQMQMIFQDPIASLDPRMTVKEIIAEGLRIAGEKKEDVINKRVEEVLNTVGLVAEHANRYPHEFSGGQRQRIGIARALVINPDFLIADEPISALDVSIQAQIINLLNDLRKEFGITILFVAHDLSVIKYISDVVGVMYFGNMVELAPADQLFANPLHPYTKSLLSAVPLADPHYEKVRKRVKYIPHESHDYSTDHPSFQEAEPGHFVLANEAEMNEYKKQLEG